MPDLTIRLVALLGGLLTGVIAWTAVALLMRASALSAAGLGRLSVIRVVLFSLLVLLAVIWVVSPTRGSPWIWPGVLVGIVGSGLVFRLAPSGRPRSVGP